MSARRKKERETHHIPVRLLKSLSWMNPSGALVSGQKGMEVQATQEQAVSWTSSGVAERVWTDAEQLVRLAKKLKVVLVTTRDDVAAAAHEEKYAAGVRES